MFFAGRSSGAGSGYTQLATVNLVKGPGIYTIYKDDKTPRHHRQALHVNKGRLMLLCFETDKAEVVCSPGILVPLRRQHAGVVNSRVGLQRQVLRLSLLRLCKGGNE